MQRQPTSDSCNVITSGSKNFIGLLSLYQAVDVNLGAVSRTISASHSLEVWVVAALVVEPRPVAGLRHVGVRGSSLTIT